MSDNKQSWFAKHKVLTGILVVIVIAILASALGGGKDSSKSGGKNDSNSAKTYRFDDRADKQKKDVEVIVGEAATVDGVSMTVKSVKYETSVSEYEKAGEGKTYVIADVEMKNTSDKTKPYNSFDFRIQTEGGQVLDGTFATVPSPLHSGDMVAGGSAKGQVVFEVPVETGHQYIIWKPSFAGERAIVQAK